MERYLVKSVRADLAKKLVFLVRARFENACAAPRE
jgi:hypothetical protein